MRRGRKPMCIMSSYQSHIWGMLSKVGNQKLHCFTGSPASHCLLTHGWSPRVRNFSAWSFSHLSHPFYSCLEIVSTALWSYDKMYDFKQNLSMEPKPKIKRYIHSIVINFLYKYKKYPALTCFYNHSFLVFTWVLHLLLISEYLLVNSFVKSELMKMSCLLLYISTR